MGMQKIHHIVMNIPGTIRKHMNISTRIMTKKSMIISIEPLPAMV
jgi:hypothetical protein